MSRGLSSANATELDNDVIRPVVFAELEFDSDDTGTLYVHDGIGQIVADDWNGVSRTWEGLGDFGGISKLEEGRDISPYNLDLVLSGIDADIADEALNRDSVLRNVYILIGFIDLDRTMVSDPHPMWSGKVDNIQIAVGSQSVIKVTCESHLASFEKSNGRLQADSDQQVEHTGDVFYQYLPQMVEAKFKWGGRTQVYATGFASIGGGSELGGENIQIEGYA
jgi:hypothetical protein